MNSILTAVFIMMTATANADEKLRGPVIAIDGIVKSFDEKTVTIALPGRPGSKILKLDRKIVHGKINPLKKSHLEIAAEDWDKVNL